MDSPNAPARALPDAAAHPPARPGATGPRTCVYTVLIGQYEQLNEQPVAADSALPFICLTDDPTLRSQSWQLRLVQPLFARDPIRSARELKIRPHLHLPDFDQSLYIDNSVLLRAPPEALLARHASSAPFALPLHSYRDSTMDEFLEVSRLGFDDQGRIFEQLNHYLLDCPEVLAQVPYWTAILWRHHQHPQVRDMLERWAGQVHRYSRRDQLSVNAAFQWAGLTPAVMPLDNYHSWCHDWPIAPGRDRARGTRPTAQSLMPVPAQLHAAQQALAGAQAAQQAQAAELQAQAAARQADLLDALAAAQAEQQRLQDERDAACAGQQVLRTELQQLAQRLAVLQPAAPPPPQPPRQPATWLKRLRLP